MLWLQWLPGRLIQSVERSRSRWGLRGGASRAWRPNIHESACCTACILEYERIEQRSVGHPGRVDGCLIPNRYHING